MNHQGLWTLASVGMVALALGLGACSSSDSGTTGKTSSASTAKKGAGATKGSAAKTSGQKASSKATAAKGQASSKGKGGSGATKNGGAHDPSAAKTAGEKAGTKASGATAKEDKGDTYEQATCDANFEAVGFCADESHVVFCADSHWWYVDCSAVEQGAFCGEDMSNSTVDCYTEAAEGDLDLVCDAESDGVAFCDDDTNLVFCAEGEWWSLDCPAIEDGAFCGEDADSLLVDCAVEGEDLTE